MKRSSRFSGSGCSNCARNHVEQRDEHGPAPARKRSLTTDPSDRATLEENTR
jgi:hypothetical protein